MDTTNTKEPGLVENDSKFDMLKLDNQICFPLYACAKEVVRAYTPYLTELDLTYTQYITMMALWEHKKISIHELGKLLYLDSGTLTPLVKKLEAKGYVTRKRDDDDERLLIVSITEKGEALKEKAVSIPMKIASCTKLEQETANELYKILHLLLDKMVVE